MTESQEPIVFPCLFNVLLIKFNFSRPFLPIRERFASMLANGLDDKSKVRILIIEDEELLREYICDYLDDLGYITSQAGNGLQGMEIIQKDTPDMVLTDLRMPEMNGLDVLAAIQKDYPDLPVIVISGTGTLSDVVQTLKLGAWDYLLKPIHDYTILELSIKRVIEQKKLIDENKRYREHLEEEVIKRTDELSKSNLRFKTLFNLAADAVFIHSGSGKISDINHQAIEYCGYNKEQLLNMSMFDLFTEPESRVFRQKISDLSQKSSILYESLLKNINSDSIPVEISASRIDLDESPQILSIIRNISERKKAEEERKQLEKQVITVQKMESLGLLASGVAHDFNNVLSALAGYTLLLRSKIQPESAEIEYLKKIKDIIDMGHNLTKRITNFVRKDKEELVKVDLHKILNDTESLLLANCKKINIFMGLHAREHFVLGDETQLQNAFLNLGINAKDAMPNGGKLTFYTQNSVPGSIDITVSDTGVGMDEDTVSKIFDPLYSTKGRGQGTGLGLTSVLYCIKNLQGKISVKSSPGNGTSFQVSLPLFE